MRSILVIFFAFAVLNIFSQGIFGIRAGVNVTNLGGDSGNADPKLGFNAGIFGEKKISDQIFLHPELNYALQGTKSSSDLKFNYSYINLPLLLRIKLASEQTSLFIGPQMGILFNANIKNGNQKQNITAELNNIDFSFALGVGGEINETASWDFRFTHSLNSTAKPSGDDPFIPNIVFQLSISKIIKQ